MKLEELTNKVEDQFSLSDLRELCFNLNINYEHVPGITRKEKIIELISYFERRNKLDELISYCQSMRPYDVWDINDSSLVVLNDSPTSKGDDSPRIIGQWVNKNYKLILSFGIAFLSLLAGIIGNLIANQISTNLSWQSLEPIIAVVIAFLTLIGLLTSYLRREPKTDIKTGNENNKGEENG